MLVTVSSIPHLFCLPTQAPLPRSLPGVETNWCPLAPLLYAVVAEVPLDMIEQESPNTLVRAYADDTALVLQNCWAETLILEQIFREFEHISGMRLNRSKCVTIPLSQIRWIYLDSDLDHERRALCI